MPATMTDTRRGYNASIERLRSTEYPQLNGTVYLDHAAMTPCSKSLVDSFSKEMTSFLFGNPHSESQASQLSLNRIEDTRLRALQFFGANPEQYDLIFTSNATAAIKLVSDAFRSRPGGFRYVYHQDSHTSVVGVREESQRSICLDQARLQDWLQNSNDPLDNDDGDAEVGGPALFAYPAQSNMCGRRYPLKWAHETRECTENNKYFTLVDAAAYASTSPLTLGDSEMAPDFTVVSFTKIFGFPNLAALIVRKEAAHVFRWRKYFGGGTVDMVVCLEEQWHAPKSQLLHERLEDGTLPVHNIVALGIAFSVHSTLFGTMEDVSFHTKFLSSRLYTSLSELRHSNGQPVCQIYSLDPSPEGDVIKNGPIVAFNIISDTGEFISPSEFDKLATIGKFEVRTGGLCNPGGIASALHLQPWEMQRNFSAGFRCGKESDLIGGKPAGMIRASFGAMSSVSDVDRFIGFVQEFFQFTIKEKTESQMQQYNAVGNTKSDPGLTVQDIFVYPIKSCAAFRVPRGIPWDVRPEGLAWDREWVLVHQGTGQALSQKRYPRLALIRPVIDQENGILRVTITGRKGDIAVPLTSNPSLFRLLADNVRLPRVCGEGFRALIYNSAEINSFFSSVLDVPCELARFPSASTGQAPRLSKAKIQRHQPQFIDYDRISNDEQHNIPRHPILLANESAMLLVNSASVDRLNNEIKFRGGNMQVTARSFRPNIVVGPREEKVQRCSRDLAYAEDGWQEITIGGHSFTMVGSCRRCQMICVDQETGEKHDEPLATLSKTRRFNGKIFFGSHMHHDADSEILSTQVPRIRVGDAVQVERCG